MAPKVKITKEMVISAAAGIAEKSGYDALTARNVAASISCSTQPVYSCFRTMDELKAEVFAVLREKCLGILFDGVDPDDFLCSLSKSILAIALDRPGLFGSVFANPRLGGIDLFERVKSRFDTGVIFGDQGRMYDLREEDIRNIFDKVRFFSLGFAISAASQASELARDEAERFLEKTVREIISGSFLALGY